MAYRLSATLTAHSSDVRAVASPTNELVLSASRDATAISWQRSSGSNDFTPSGQLKPGERYVNAVAYISPSNDAPHGYAVTGGQDSLVNVFKLGTGKQDPDFSLLGHSANVCTLYTTPTGTIASGSWDQTAKVWKNFQLAYDLKGHNASVWAVIAIDDEQFITGSADKTIKMWQKDKAIATFTGHRDAVRGLALIPDIGFASCSNDADIRVWSMDGDTIFTLTGHTSFVYSLSILPNGDIVSGGEDRTVRVWKDGELSQIITHPAISVWAVSTMPNGDIVSGCSDGIVRVFSASEERHASSADLKEYEEQVASQAISAEQAGDIKQTDLPGPEALKAPGTTAGEIRRVKNASVVEEHRWDAIRQQWQKIGEIVTAVQQRTRKPYQGKEYDYVFDVDIQEGAPPLKLPYNANENPFTAAQRFLANNELPMSYLDEVVRFIQTNTEGVQLGATSEEYSDPFTGAGRYRSNAGPSAPQANSSYVDPYTGASRYVSTTTSSTNTPSGGTYVDPYTGTGRYTGAPTSKILPTSNYVPFKAARVSAIHNKFLEFNSAFRQEISTSNTLSCYPEELNPISEIVDYLAELTSSPPTVPSTQLQPSHIEVIMSVLERWPPVANFPLVDLSRLLVGYCPGLFTSAPGLQERLFVSLFKATEWDQNWEIPLPKEKETTVLLLFRALSNVFQEGCTVETSWLIQILTGLEPVPYVSLGKNQRAAYATLLFNISCLLLRDPLDINIRDQHFTLLLKVLTEEKSESEPAYRALVGLGNVIFALKKVGAPLDASQGMSIRAVVKPLKSTFSADARVANVIEEINAAL